MVVAEIVSSHGQPATEAAGAPAPQSASTTAVLKPICFSLLLAGGLVLSQMEMAQAQVVADPSAPKNQQPTILNTANGVPQINIQTPSGAGVSRNTYSQFDVDRQGAILNNARNSVQTQLGGWVQGNPWLAAGTARVILNEVNASNPSQLRGYVEVAGDRAQVVIANPAGISCDGCGFINANRATLTTGSAVLNGGSLEGYRVQQGNIVVSGAGMDGRQTDYTDLIARSVQLNAGIWASKLQVNTGASQVSVDLSQSTALTPSAPAPQYLLDVASLGGMYAGKITLVGNEHGVGMRQAGQIGATAGDVVVTQDGRLENSGKMSAGGNLQVSTTGNVVNTGSMVASGNASVDASQAQISNQAGAILGANGNVNLHAASISNSGSLISAGLQLSVLADTLDNQQTQNTAQGLQAQSINITTAQLNNQHGQILADHALSVQSSGGLDNTAGLISSAQSVSLQDTQPSKTLAITNTGGTVQAGQQLSITSSSLSGDGTIQSTGNLAINLQGDFTNTGTVQASGTASLNTAGKISNQSALSANGALHLSAANLDNAASATINAGTTQLDITNTLNNRGLIDGENTWLSAATLNNLGTGRIYGTQLALSASTLNNAVENGTAATIASRDRLDLGVGTLNNREHALIFSNGDMAIGGSLDANHHAVGSATTLNNNSASIEALGNLSLAATTINNTNEHFATAILPVGSPQSIVEYQGSGSPNRYTPGTPGVYIYNDESDHLMTPEGSFESWTKYEYSRNTQATTVTQTDPGSISAGGRMQIAANSLINDKSHIVAGGVLTAAVQDLQNREVSGQQIVTDNGGVTSYWRDHKKGRDDTGSSWAAYNPAPVITDISLATVKFQQNTAPTASATQIASLSTNSVTTQQTSTLQLAANNSLFHLSSNPQLGYLVETDPRFANYKNWLSSDYLLNALSYDPATVQKRLGDGFYEQKLLREQVAQLTGRRFLDGYSNDEAQYRALLEQGATVAKAWNLRPGIALTAQQISQLTSDIVWLVEKDVTLPNGTVTKALVPQLYVQVKPGDLNGNGALIAGNALDLKLSGTLDNQGSIAGRTVVSLTANTVNNLGGRITGQDVAVSAATDLNVIGGRIDAANSLQATAGNDLNVTTTTRSNSNAQGSVTNLNRLAGLYVNNPTGATLVASAGHDLNLVAAEISNSSSGGNTVLAAGNKLNLSTVSTGNQQSIVWDGNNHRQDSSRQDVGSAVQTTGDTKLIAGQDINAQAASIVSTQGVMQLAAGRDIAIKAGSTQQIVDEAHQHKGKSGLLSSTTITDITHRDSTALNGSQISGQQVQLQAGRDLTVAASNINATGALEATAQRDIDLQTQARKDISTSIHQEKKSGLSANFLTGVQVGASQSQQNDASKASLQTGSTLSGQNVTLTAGRDATASAASVLADQNLNVQAGRNVNILAATNTMETNHQASASSWSVGLVSGAAPRQTMFGTTASTENGTQTSTTQSTSLLSANSGKLTVLAGADNQYTGSGQGNLLSQGANLQAKQTATLQGNTVTLDAISNQDNNQYHQETKSFTIGSQLSGTVGSVITSVYDAAQAARNTSNDRLQGALALKAGYDAYKLVNGGAAKALQEQAAANIKDTANNASRGNASAFGVSTTVGSNSSSQDSSSNSTTQRGTIVQADTLNIIATDGNLSATGAKLQATDINLSASKDILLQAATNTAEVHNKNDASNASVGATFGFGQQNGISFQVGVGQSQGVANGSETTYDNTLVTASNQLNLHSGNDTTLFGAQLAGKTVHADVGGKLAITTLQDQSQYESHQSSSGFDISVCVPPICYGQFVSGSANLAAQDINHDYQSATGQSGIAAGSGGFNLNVAGNTSLTGAAITSQASAEHNKLTTGSLSYQDLNNHQHTDASSTSIGISAGNGSTLLSNVMSNLAANALGNAGLPKNNDESSQTKSVISPASVTITSGDAASKTAADTLTARDASTANGALTNSLTLQQAQQLQQKLKDTQDTIKAAQIIGNIGRDITNTISQQKRDEADKILATSSDPADRAAALAMKQQYGTGGDFQRAGQAISAAIQGLVGGDMKGAVTDAAAPYLAQVVKQMTTDADGNTNLAANAMAHAALGALLAAAKGQNTTAGAVGGGIAPITADLVMNQLYPGKTVAELSDEQKQTVAALTTLTGTLAGGLSTGNSAGAVTAGQVANNEVLNNSLSKSAGADWIAKLRNLTPSQQEAMLAKYRADAQVLTQQAKACTSDCQTLTAQLQSNRDFFNAIANAFDKKDPVQASMYRQEAKAAQADLNIAFNRAQDLASGRANYNTGASSAFTVQGIAPGQAYATYEQQNQKNFLVLAGTAALPAGGYGLVGPAVGDAMLISGGVAGGFDAAGQYAQNCAQGNCKVSSINPVQSLFAVNTAMVMGPAIGPLGTWGAKVAGGPSMLYGILFSGVAGGAGGYINTSFNNAYSEKNDSAWASAGYGVIFGGAGSAIGTGTFRWAGSSLNSSSVNNVISNFPSFLPTPSVVSDTNSKADKQ